MHRNIDDQSIIEVKDKLKVFEEFFTVNGLKDLYDIIIDIPEECTITHEEYYKFKQLEKTRVVLFDIEFIDTKTLKEIEFRQDEVVDYELDDLIGICNELEKTTKIKIESINKKNALRQQSTKIGQISNKNRSSKKLDLEKLKKSFDLLDGSLTTLLNKWPFSQFISHLSHFGKLQSQDIRKLQDALNLIFQKPVFLKDWANFEILNCKLSSVIHKNLRLKIECQSLETQIKFMDKFDVTFPDNIDCQSCLSEEVEDQILLAYSNNRSISVIGEFTELYNSLGYMYYQRVNYYKDLVVFLKIFYFKASDVIENISQPNLEEMFKKTDLYFDFFEHTVQDVLKLSQSLIEVVNKKCEEIRPVHIPGSVKDGLPNSPLSNGGNSLLVERVDSNAVLDIVKETCDFSKRTKLCLKRSIINEKIDSITSALANGLNNFL